jgi:hypothetical protein
VSDKEATARIKINKLLEAAGWRFFPEGNAPANIRLEPGVTIKSTDLDALGANDFRAVPQRYRTLVPDYVKDYISLNQFAA